MSNSQPLQLDRKGRGQKIGILYVKDLLLGGVGRQLPLLEFLSGWP